MHTFGKNLKLSILLKVKYAAKLKKISNDNEHGIDDEYDDDDDDDDDDHRKSEVRLKQKS